MSDDEKRKDGDDTRAGIVPPKAPRIPTERRSEPAGAGEQKQKGGEDATVMLSPGGHRRRFSVHHVQPAGHSDVVWLSADRITVGRAEGSDVPLYSPTASRQQAELIRRGEEWFVRPSAGKSVLADGAVVKTEARLRHRTRLRFGGDEVVFLDAAATEEQAAGEGETVARRGVPSVWVIGVGVVVLAAVVVWFVLQPG